MNSYRLITALALISIIRTAPAQDIETFLHQYIDAVINEDFTAAGNFWLEADLQRSQRLGIVYTGDPLKIDSASPIFNARRQLKSGLYSWQIKQIGRLDNFFRVAITVKGINESSDFLYCIKSDSAGLELTSPFSIPDNQWAQLSAKYIELHYQDERLFNFQALVAADSFIQQLGKFFAISDERMRLLAREKIDYYLASADMVEQLTGFDAQGLANLQFDAVISRHLPHYHELTHLMLNFALHELPLYTLPLFQEGAAAGFGGRWGKSPQVILQLGELYLRDGWLQPESAFAWRDFHALGADMAYPLAALWTRFLQDKLGGEKFRNLYLSFSADAEKVMAMDEAGVKQILCDYSRLDWQTLKTAFLDYSKSFKYNGIIPLQCMPRNIIPYFSFEKNSSVIKIYYYDDDYYCEIELGSAKKLGVFVNPQNKSSVYQSWMFAEQFPKEIYTGEEMGIVFLPGEAGIYDYNCNILTAKLTQVFQGREGFEEEGIIRCKITKSIWREGEMKTIIVE